LSDIGGAVDTSREGEDCGCFAGTGRTIEEEVRKAVGVDEFVDGSEDVLVAGDIVEGYGSVLLDPARSSANVTMPDGA
jgi:hypothetical protein